jgi:hypothetical protein
MQIPFVAQSLDWVHAQRPPYRKVTGRQGDSQQYHRNNREREAPDYIVVQISDPASRPAGSAPYRDVSAQSDSVIRTAA